jgi:hypothetical protein
MRSLVAPAMNAPSGVNAKATTPDPMVIEDLDLVSDERAFQMLIAPSSPADTNNRSAGSAKVAGFCIGCQIREVISPW